MNWHKISLVLRREYLHNFRKPSFLFTAFGVPLISLVAMFFITQVVVNRETNLDAFQRVGYIDRGRKAGTAEQALRWKTDSQPTDGESE